ncbi:hypothetical protein B0181_09205 [Moraxella caviae]|uniref:Uncharacterized protein n=1 Tax=Moraxella caviae TaxID=34060 RepID=A0A1S9ZXD2_9GAMM|nr:hypothetical protein B0181_09205 [Moraxella caviae]
MAVFINQNLPQCKNNQTLPQFQAKHSFKQNTASSKPEFQAKNRHKTPPTFKNHAPPLPLPCFLL